MFPLGHVLNDKLIRSSSDWLTGTLCCRLLGNNINSPRFIGNINVALLNVLNFSVDNDLSNYDNSSSGFSTLTGTETLTNKTLTSPKVNEDVAVTATATQLNHTVGVTSAIQTQLDTKATSSQSIAFSLALG